MMTSSHLSHIENAPENPMDLFKEFLNLMKEQNKAGFITMSLATLNSEFGVLNRTVVFRGLTKKHEENITFVTERNSQKYKDIQENPKVSVVFLFHYENNNKLEFYQVRIHGTAIERSKEEIIELWHEEPVFAKIRSKITKCGAPVDWDILSEKHNTLLENYVNGEDCLNQTETFTSFEIVADVIDFYFAENKSVGDRVLYRRQKNNTWSHGHVYP